MDPRLLRYYNKELQYIREMGGEFAQAYPKIAGRLGLDAFECADPYVERLLEGFAFLTARVQLKQDAEFPRFTQQLLEMVYPQYLAPVPSMLIAQFAPDLKEGDLAKGYVVPRGTSLQSVIGKDQETECEYRTAHDVTLFPMELCEARYYTRDIVSLDVPDIAGARAALRLRLRTTAGLQFHQISLDRLSVFIRGSDELPMRIYEQLFTRAVGVVVRPTSKPAPWREVLDVGAIAPVGFRDEEALLPQGPRSFQGYRLLREYFAFPQRFLYFELSGLGSAVARAEETELDIVVLLADHDPALEGVIDAANFALFTSPAINLFPRRADRIHVSERAAEQLVVPDRTRPLDFEVYEVERVRGYGTSSEEEREFLPFYAANDLFDASQDQAYFSVQRVPRVLSDKERRGVRRSTYVGSEVYVSLVDAGNAPYSTSLQQLGLELTCTNRDLPLHMTVGQGATDLTLETGAPVEAIVCLAGPTRPRPSFSEGETAWRLISHLSLNYMSLVDSDGEGAAALRELLSLYCDPSEPHLLKQIDGVRSIASTPVTRRLPMSGPIAFGRGLELSVTCEESAFEGTGVFLLGAVLEQFFARYVSVNSFTETVLRTVDRGEVKRWPIRIGLRPTL